MSQRDFHAWPWLDRKGRFSFLKMAVLVGLFLPLLWLGIEAREGSLGPRPIVEATHFTGLWAVRLLLLSLFVTPIRQIFRWAPIMLVRRMIGIGALAYGLGHLALYAADLQWNFPRIGSEIVLRIYLTIGFLALLGLIVLGATSTDGWIRRLGGRRWQLLHRLAYVIGLLTLIHFTLQSKLDVSEAMLMAGFFLWLMGCRALIWTKTRLNFWKLCGLACFASIGAALLEAGWYGLATGAPLQPILEANLEFQFGLRPSHWVALTGLSLAVLSLCRLGRRDTEMEPGRPRRGHPRRQLVPPGPSSSTMP